MKKIITAAILILGLACAAIFFIDFFKKPEPPQNGPKTPDTSREVLLYYYNPGNDKDDSGNVMCSRAGLVPVSRRIPATATPIQDTIKLLLSGQLSESEKTAGIATEFPLPAFELVGANLENNILTLEFSDPNNTTSGGSCRAAILWYQIEATAKQFPGVNEVRYIPETLFQP